MFNKREEAFKLLNMFITNSKTRRETCEQILTRNFAWSMSWDEIKQFSREFRKGVRR